MQTPEEFWGELFYKWGGEYYDDYRLEASSAIAARDAEIRRECAERFGAKIESWHPENPELQEIQRILLTDGIAAIIGEEG